MSQLPWHKVQYNITKADWFLQHIWNLELDAGELKLKSTNDRLGKANGIKMASDDWTKVRHKELE